jgi:hypothetical protein
MKKRKAIVLFGIFVIVMAIWYEFYHKGPLESTPMGSVYIEKGETLLSACERLEAEIKAKGGNWVVVVDSRIADKKSPSYCGGGGSALVVFSVRKNYGSW